MSTAKPCPHARTRVKRYVGSTETYRFCDDCWENIDEDPRWKKLKQAAAEAIEQFSEAELESYLERRGP